MIMPKVRIRDNMRLDPNEYRIKIADMPVAQDRLEPGHLLAIDSGMTTGQIDGIDDQRPCLRHRCQMDPAQPARRSRNDGLHRGRTGGRAGHASDGSLSPPCRRDPHPRRHQTPDRRTQANSARCRRRVDPQYDVAGGSAGRVATPAPRAGANSPARPDPRNPRRLRAAERKTPSC